MGEGEIGGNGGKGGKGVGGVARHGERERACSVGTWVNRAVSAMQGGRTKRERDLVTYAVGALADGLLDFLVLGSNRRHVVFELAA